jgi:hypothetical protein
MAPNYFYSTAVNASGPTVSFNFSEGNIDVKIYRK